MGQYLTIVDVCNTTIDGPETVGWFTISIVTETVRYYWRRVSRDSSRMFPEMCGSVKNESEGEGSRVIHQMNWSGGLAAIFGQIAAGQKQNRLETSQRPCFRPKNAARQTKVWL